MLKKNQDTTYASTTQTITSGSQEGFESEIWRDVKKALATSLVTAAVTLFGFGVITYFTVLSLSARVVALESSTVRKDVLAETILPIRETTERIEAKLDRLIEKQAK